MLNIVTIVCFFLISQVILFNVPLTVCEGTNMRQRVMSLSGITCSFADVYIASCFVLSICGWGTVPRTGANFAIDLCDYFPLMIYIAVPGKSNQLFCKCVLP